MDTEAVCRLCSKPIRAGARTLEFGGEAVHITCASLESRLQSLFVREESQALGERVAVAIQRAKAAMVPANSSILVGCLDKVDLAERRLMVGGVAFEAANGIDLVRLRPGSIVRVVYDPGRVPGTHRATNVRPLGVPR